MDNESAFCALLSALCSEVRIAADFRGLTPPGRAIRDIRFPCDLSNAKGLAFDLKVDCLDEFSMFTFHFDCNGKWVGAPLKPQVEGRWARGVGAGDRGASENVRREA